MVWCGVVWVCVWGKGVCMRGVGARGRCTTAIDPQELLGVAGVSALLPYLQADAGLVASAAHWELLLTAAMCCVWCVVLSTRHSNTVVDRTAISIDSIAAQ